MHSNSPPQQTFAVQPPEVLPELPPELTQQDTPWTAALQCPTGVVVQVPTGQDWQLPSVPSHWFEVQLLPWAPHPKPSHTPAHGTRTPNTKT